MSQELYFRSVGLIRGTYLPSNEDMYQGTLLTEQGIFPAELKQSVINFFNRDTARRKRRKKSGKPAIAKENNFICWIAGINSSPYYRFQLIGWNGKNLNNEINNLLPEPNTFITRGIVIKRDRSEVIQRIQKNPKPERTKEEIANFKCELKILDCPGKVRKNQFWLFKSSLIDGFLHCQSAEFLAYAKEAKKLLVS